MTILDKIVAEKRQEVARLLPQAGRIHEAVARRRDYRDFGAALRDVGAVSNRDRESSPVADEIRSHERPLKLIAEVKKASPSAGVIQPNFDPVRIAQEFAAAGAAALSVLTDEKFFQGKVEYLGQIREAVSLPLLRKDFIIDELQVYESAGGGADAVLLIVAILDDAQLKNYRALAQHLQMAALVEVHNEGELARALNAGAALIGINNRDLKTFRVDLAATERLVALAPKDRLIVAESGIHTRADVERVAVAGAQAILVGESLMKSGNIATKVKELLG